jgi:hypothetical protein
MKKYWLLAPLCALTCLQCLGQELTKTDSLQQSYEKKKKNANTLMLAGGISMGAGLAMGVVAAAQATEELFVSPWTDQNINENAGEGAAIAGAVLFWGGAALLTAGIITNGKANKMKREQLVFIKPVSPPIQLPKGSIQQQGISLSIRLSR